jgi:hypothetical protein
VLIGRDRGKRVRFGVEIRWFLTHLAIVAPGGVALRPNALPVRVEQRLVRDLRRDPAAEDPDLDLGADLHLGRHVGVGDRALRGIAVAAGRGAALALKAQRRYLRTVMTIEDLRT